MNASQTTEAPRREGTFSISKAISTLPERVLSSEISFEHEEKVRSITLSNYAVSDAETLLQARLESRLAHEQCDHYDELILKAEGELLRADLLVNRYDRKGQLAKPS